MAEPRGRKEQKATGLCWWTPAEHDQKCSNGGCAGYEHHRVINKAAGCVCPYDFVGSFVDHFADCPALTGRTADRTS